MIMKPAWLALVASFVIALCALPAPAAFHGSPPTGAPPPPVGAAAMGWGA